LLFGVVVVVLACHFVALVKPLALIVEEASGHSHYWVLAAEAEDFAREHLKAFEE
jgi:hypothetical protein